GSRFTGQLLRLRYALNDKVTLSAGAILSNRGGARAACPVDVQNVPCGFGPGDSDYDRFRLGNVGVQAQLGNVALTVNAGAYGGRYTSDQLSDVVLGVPMPSGDTYDYDSRSASASLNVTVRRHTLALGFDTSASRDMYTPLDLTYSRPTFDPESSSDLNLTDTYKISTKLAVRAGLSTAAATGARASLLETVGGNWKPSTSETFDVSAQFGSAQPIGTREDTFAEPSRATYTCDGLTRLGGPGDTNTSKQSSTSYNATWTHNWSGGQLTTTVYRTLQIGQTFYGAVPIGSEPAGYIPPGFLDAIEAAWNRPTSCAGVPFNPNSIYIVEGLAGTSRRYEGFSVSGRVLLGRNVTLFPSYSTTAATLLSADARLLGPYSFIVPGWQLPGRPLHTAVLTLDTLQPHAGLEWIVNAQYAGANNNRRLGAYTQLNAGVARTLARGTLTAFVSNALNTDAGIFFSTRYAYRLPLAGGGAIAQSANPLTPRVFTVQYSVRTNRK
ncbi:MAG: hypothetical protein JOZ86_01910, partial [Candidatus Eremiobacteraeota bacterium]|nr:hypothetical protein [Candidatus Eremiobacteraeota bacterium]